MIYKTTSAEQTEALGEALGKRLHGGEIVAYVGGLGAGKTAFTRGSSLASMRGMSPVSAAMSRSLISSCALVAGFQPKTCRKGLRTLSTKSDLSGLKTSRPTCDVLTRDLLQRLLPGSCPGCKSANVL